MDEEVEPYWWNGAGADPGLYAVRFAGTTHFEQVYVREWRVDPRGLPLFFIDSGDIMYLGTAIIALKKIS
jgi:hypothetical protein